jgi:hypothetical protein
MKFFCIVTVTIWFCAILQNGKKPSDVKIFLTVDFESIDSDSLTFWSWFGLSSIITSARTAGWLCSDDVFDIELDRDEDMDGSKISSIGFSFVGDELTS